MPASEAELWPAPSANRAKSTRQALTYPDLDMLRLAEGIDALADRPAADAAHFSVAE
jgi:hypothetical protein